MYAHSSSCNLSKESAYQLTIGASNFSTDFGNAKMVMFIGRSYGDGIRPSSVQSLASAAESGTRVVIVDPRLNNSGIFADDWVPITPGTDIALLLGMANVLIEEDLYDHEFVEQNTTGFEEFAAEVKQYTPSWAEKICDVPADRIQELARAMAKAAPAASIEAGWRAVIGCSYANSFETARVITAVNSLLGAWGAKGGALLTSSPKAGKIEDARFADPAKPDKPRVGNKEYPLALDSAGTNIAALQAALDGTMKGLFFYNSNAAKGYAQPKTWAEALGKCDLVVTIDVQMSETALQSHYVLPEVTYLERLELPEFVGGKKHFVGMRTAVLDRIHPETKTCDEIFNGLAEACGVGEYFQFTAEDWAAAQLETVGVSLEQLKKDGVVELSDPHFEYGVPKFKTASGKFEFKTDKMAEWLQPGHRVRAAQGHAGRGRVLHRGRAAGHPFPHHDAEHRGAERHLARVPHGTSVDGRGRRRKAWRGDGRHGGGFLQRAHRPGGGARDAAPQARRRVPSHPLRRGLAVSDALLSVRHQSDRLHSVRR